MGVQNVFIYRFTVERDVYVNACARVRKRLGGKKSANVCTTRATNHTESFVHACAESVYVCECNVQLMVECDLHDFCSPPFVLLVMEARMVWAEIGRIPEQVLTIHVRDGHRHGMQLLRYHWRCALFRDSTCSTHDGLMLSAAAATCPPPRLTPTSTLRFILFARENLLPSPPALFFLHHPPSLAASRRRPGCRS